MTTPQLVGPDMSAVQSEIDQIKKNRAGGASKQTLCAARLLIRCARSSPENLPDVAMALMAAQPMMGSIFNLAEMALLAHDVPSACAEFLEDLERNTARLVEFAAPLVQDGMTVMTHSFSSTVLAALREAARKTRFSVICPESRPVCEGVAMAVSLGVAGIEASLIADSCMCSFSSQVRLVLVGADAISSRNLFNKSGTRLLALAAREWNVPVYAVCPSNKFLPPSYVPPPETPKDPRELLERELPNVSIVNYYFDETPLEYFTGIITEDGILQPAELRDRIVARRIPLERGQTEPLRPDAAAIDRCRTGAALAC